MVCSLVSQGNAYNSQQKLDTLAEVKLRARIQNPTSFLPGQCGYIVVEHVERKTPRVLLEVRQEEIVPLVKEVPSMVQLNPPQLGKPVSIALGPEGKIDKGRRKDSSHANCTGKELAVFARDRT